MITTTRPDRSEAADYYFTYIDKVDAGDVLDILDVQSREVLGLLQSISEEQSQHRYAPGKWSIRQVLSHINDTERMFVHRAVWFARGLPEPLPSFDQDAAVANAGADQRSWRSHVDEFQAIRASSVAFFRHLPDEAWMRRGVASGYEFTVHALAFITAGHVAHHVKGLRENYLAPAAR